MESKEPTSSGHFNVITLGVQDIEASAGFYESVLTFKRRPTSQKNVVFFDAGAMILALYPQKDLYEFTGIQAVASSEKITSILLSFNVDGLDSLKNILRLAESSKGRIIRPPFETSWGAIAAVFIDLDGHAWELSCPKKQKIPPSP